LVHAHGDDVVSPRESYPDSMHAALVGRYSAGIDELTVPYAKPQESGHRSGLHSLELSNAGKPWLRIDALPDAAGRRPGFTLSRLHRRSAPQPIRTNCRTAGTATCTSTPPSTAWARLRPLPARLPCVRRPCGSWR